MDVAFCGQAFGRRSQLNVVRATGDDALARLEAAAYGHDAGIARGDVDEAPSETFTGNLHEDVGPARFHQHRFLRDDRQPLSPARVEDGRPGLADEQSAVSVFNFNLKGEGARLRIDDARIVHVIRFQLDGLFPSGDFQSNGSQTPSRVGIIRRHLSPQFDTVSPNDPEERRSLCV